LRGRERERERKAGKKEIRKTEILKPSKEIGNRKEKLKNHSGNPEISAEQTPEVVKRKTKKEKGKRKKGKNFRKSGNLSRTYSRK
jgi:hypothetical protein